MKVQSKRSIYPRSPLLGVAILFLCCFLFQCSNPSVSPDGHSLQEPSAEGGHANQENTPLQETTGTDAANNSDKSDPERLQESVDPDTALPEQHELRSSEQITTERQTQESPTVDRQPPDSKGSLQITISSLSWQTCQGSVQTLKASGGSGKGYVWHVQSGSLPDGLQLSKTGTPWSYLFGTPSSPGVYKFTLQVTDSLGNIGRKAFSIHIKPSTRIFYVDQKLSINQCTSYDPSSRSCGKGTQRAYKTLKGAADTATAGSSVYVRGGTYQEQLIPKHSGSVGCCILFRNYQKEKVIITGSKYPGIIISNRSHLIIEGFQVSNIRRWLYGIKSSHNIIKGNHFLNAHDKGGSSKTGLFFQEATYNKILNNTIEQTTQDNLALIKSDRNLVEGNTFRKGKHVLWVIKCGNNNVIRNNDLHNEWQKLGEIYDCDGVGFNKEFDLVNATKSNLVHGNVFAYTPSSGNSSPYAGIQYAGQQGIIRYNRFYKTVGPGLSFALYGKEARYNTANRVYNNVFYKSDFAGISFAAGANFKDNIFKNNILFQNVFRRNDKRWNWYNELDGKPVQLLTGRKDGFVFERNVFFNQRSGEKYLLTHGSRTSSSNGAQEMLTWWEKNHPKLFLNNQEKEPQFVNAAKFDFRLQASSPMKDAGIFLTKTVGAGRGKTMKVQDASYFYDGYQIPGEIGDIIQIEGSHQTARIVKIDQKQQTLTFDRSLSWKDGAGISLAFYGKAPDLGAYELSR